MIIKLIGNIIPILLGIIAILKWKKELGLNNILERLGLKPLSLLQLTSGIFIGALIFTIIFISFQYFDFLAILQFSWSRGNIFTTLLLFFIAAIIEELIFRCFFINGLKLYFESTFAILIISAFFFSLVHWLNNGSSVITAISAFIGGIMYAYAFIKTSKIWYPLGLHFSWNFFQSFVYGFPVSGFNFKGLFEIELIGQEIWTGGEYGPEGGLIGIIARLIIIFITWLIYKKQYSS